MRGAISYQSADDRFTRIVKAQMIVHNQNQETISKKVGNCKKTTNLHINNPETMTVKELREYVKVLRIEPKEISALIYGKEPNP